MKSLDAIQADFTKMASHLEENLKQFLPAEDIIDLMVDDQICPSVEWFSLGSLLHAIDAAQEAVDALRTTAAFTSSNVLITWAARKAAEAETPGQALEALYAFLGLIRRNNGNPRGGSRRTFGRILTFNESTATVFLPELAPHQPLVIPAGLFDNFDLQGRPDLAKLFAELAADDDEEESPMLRPSPGAMFYVRIEPSEDGWELMEASAAPPIGWLTVFGLARCILDLDTVKERPAFPAMVRVMSKSSRNGLWVLAPELDPYPFLMTEIPNGIGAGDLYIAHAQRVQGKRERPENWTVTTRDWRPVQETDVRSSLRSILSVMLVYCEEDRQSAGN